MIVRDTFVYCDGLQCPRNGEPLNAERWMPAREQLRGSGWLTRGGRHYCADCRAMLAAGQIQETDPPKREKENCDGPEILAASLHLPSLPHKVKCLRLLNVRQVRATE